MLQMVMHVCSVAQEIAENWCERNHQEQEREEADRITHSTIISVGARCTGQ
jgi:hypothetical protein